MAINETIPVINADETPLLTDPVNFSIYTDNYHLKLASIITSINVWRVEANSTSAEINASESAIQSMKTSIDSTNSDIDIKKTDIDNKYIEITNYVIPTEATYSSAAIDAKINDAEILTLTGAI